MSLNCKTPGTHTSTKPDPNNNPNPYPNPNASPDLRRASEHVRKAQKQPNYPGEASTNIYELVVFLKMGVKVEIKTEGPTECVFMEYLEHQIPSLP